MWDFDCITTMEVFIAGGKNNNNKIWVTFKVPDVSRECQKVLDICVILSLAWRNWRAWSTLDSNTLLYNKLLNCLCAPACSMSFTCAAPYSVAGRQTECCDLIGRLWFLDWQTRSLLQWTIHNDKRFLYVLTMKDFVRIGQQMYSVNQLSIIEQKYFCPWVAELATFDWVAYENFVMILQKTFVYRQDIYSLWL